MTPLEKEIRQRIALDGPMTVADYMSLCLGHPIHGYYMTRDPFGRQGDFTTAPEISQTFGELIGLWCAEMWRLMGCPDQVRLVELGPGRGTLMSDILRAAQRLPKFLDAVCVHLVEMSPVLSELQKGTLASAPVLPKWHLSLADVPQDGPFLFVANEFFDALPIRQLQRTPDGWRERVVVVHPESDALAIAAGGVKTDTLVDARVREKAEQGRVVEISPASWQVATEIGDRLAGQGGTGLFIDYGYEGPATGDTLQAVRDHEPCSVFDDPGNCDLTAHVDFTRLAVMFGEAGCISAPVAEQGDFLRALGIDYRTKALIEAAPHLENSLMVARDRLIGPDAMGKLFKVLGVKSAGLPALPGLEAEG